MLIKVTKKSVSHECLNGFGLSSHLQGGGHIDFGVILVWILVPVGITLSCLHSILLTSSRILTKFQWIYNWDIAKN